MRYGHAFISAALAAARSDRVKANPSGSDSNTDPPETRRLSPLYICKSKQVPFAQEAPLPPLLPLGARAVFPIRRGSGPRVETAS